MAADADDVTVAILNYNGRELLEVVLPTIFSQTATGFAVHILDNCSTDDSLDYVAREWPAAKVFPSPANTEITRNMVRAIESAQTTYVALLNNDLELDECWLEEMRAELDRHPEAAAVDGKMLSYHDRARIDGAGDRLRRSGHPGRRGERELDRGQFDVPAEVFSASGGAALYRRAAFEDVGPYDVDLIAYYEDVDWGFRARLMGWTTRYTPAAISFHMGSTTTKRTPSRYGHLVIRNQILLVVKNMPTPLLLRLAPRLLFFEIKWLVFDCVHHNGRAHVRGLGLALRELPAWWSKRRAVQRSARAHWREIARMLD